MASHLARAARRLTGIRGLGDALADAGASSSSGRQLAAAQRAQPWAVTSMRAHAGGSDGADNGSSSSSSSQVPPPGSSNSLSLGLEENTQASTSTSRSEAAAAEAAAAALRARPPPGHTDFQQRQLLMLFTCAKCDTRAAKGFSKQSYEQGVVIVDCPGCHSKHLIADNLGWFGQKGTVEEFAAEHGNMVVKKLADGTVELTPEELLGRSLVAEAEAAEAAAAHAGLGSGGAAAAEGTGPGAGAAAPVGGGS